jgi:hypothetical protein
MRKFIIEPFIGVGPVRIGMTRAEVLRAMSGRKSDPFRKGPDAIHETDAFYGSCFQVFYEGAARHPVVDFIELSRGYGLRPFYRDCDVFGTPAAKVVAQISQDCPYDADDPDIPYSYLFRKLQLSLWRQCVPESARDKEGRYFDTIGIGRKGYYDGVAAT